MWRTIPDKCRTPREPHCHIGPERDEPNRAVGTRRRQLRTRADPLIRSSGHTVQDRPLRSMRWADIPQLCIGDRCCPPSGQQYWRQSRCSSPRPRLPAPYRRWKRALGRYLARRGSASLVGLIHLGLMSGKARGESGVSVLFRYHHDPDARCADRWMRQFLVLPGQFPAVR